MTNAFLQWVDRSATSISQAAALAVVPLAAIALLVHGI
jgi:hypothetical protein